MIAVAMRSLFINKLPVLLALLWAVDGSSAQTTDEPPVVDSRFQEDQRIETDTALGRLTIGVSGISENEKLGATTGDVELGYLYSFEFDSEFPRVAELRPFLFNRAESTDTTYYESLGIGAGLRLSLRKKYEENNWFVRFSMLTPTDAYRERYDMGRNQSSIVEFFTGYEVPLSDLNHDHDMRERVTGPTLIELGVPAVMFDLPGEIDPAVLERVHTLMVAAYLAKVSQLHGVAPAKQAKADSDWRVLHLIEQVTDERLTQVQWLVLSSDAVTGAEERVDRRRQIVAEFVRRGITQLMREPYPLICKPFQPQQGGTFPARTAQHVGLISRPGMKLQPSQQPLDADTMIEHYIKHMTAQIQ